LGFLVKAKTHRNRYLRRLRDQHLRRRFSVQRQDGIIVTLPIEASPRIAAADAGGVAAEQTRWENANGSSTVSLLYLFKRAGC
jgi:hypothetical protein